VDRHRNECFGTGGALAIFGPTTVRNTKFWSNAASEGGGGVYYCPHAAAVGVKIADSTFYRNGAGSFGGAIALDDYRTLSGAVVCQQGAMTITKSQFVESFVDLDHVSYIRAITTKAPFQDISGSSSSNYEV